MSSIGYIQVHAYASDAELPLRDVAILITAPDQTAIAMRLTDRSGLIRAVEIPVPDRSESQDPGSVERPYTQVNLYAYKQGYERFASENVQVFAGTTTFQDLEMVPLADIPNGGNDTIQIDTPPQNL